LYIRHSVRIIIANSFVLSIIYSIFFRFASLSYLFLTFFLLFCHVMSVILVTVCVQVIAMLDTPFLSKLDLFFSVYPVSRYKRKDLILHANDNPSSVFYIKSGYVRVYRLSEQGEELTLTILKPHDFFPLTYGMTAPVNPYYLEAITPLDLWRASQEKFLTFVKANPAVLFELTNRILVKFDGMVSRMEQMVFSNAYVKVATMLLICAKRFGKTDGDSSVVQVPLTHRDIATLVGITRETASLEMKKLEKQGFVGKLGRLFVVKQMKRFEEKVLVMSQEGGALSYSL
jgi:CRP/FNR family transcriptional regulator, cyclic AMP receptor protein